MSTAEPRQNADGPGREKRPGPAVSTADGALASDDHGSRDHRQNGAALLVQLGRLVLDGPAPPVQRLRVASEQAAALVTEGRIGRTSAVAALRASAQAAGVPRTTAEQIVRSAFRSRGRCER